jgi:hypothetical protein
MLLIHCGLPGLRASRARVNINYNLIAHALAEAFSTLLRCAESGTDRRCD